MFVRSALAFATAAVLAFGTDAFAAQDQPVHAPTFSRDIAPILYANCVSCHSPGGAGPFALLTYENARAHAKEIAVATGSGFMPPFPPQAAPGRFADERRLSQQQIDCISRWVRNGTPEGDRAETPPLPSLPAPGDWQLGPPDMVLEAEHPVEVQPDGPDVFWNLIFRPNLNVRRCVRAVEIKPGDTRIAHHANLLLDRTGAVVRREPRPGYGFPGMDLNISRNPLDPESHFLFWKPG